MSPEARLARAAAVALSAVVLCTGAARALPPATLQYSTVDAHVFVHALATPSGGGPPQVLLSEAAEQFAPGPRTLRVARAAQNGAGSEQRELAVLQKLGPVASMAVDRRGRYALAVSDETGLRVSFHARDGQRLADAEPIPDQVPIALFVSGDETVLVGNRGYFLLGADGTRVQHSPAPPGTYVAAALWAGDRPCALLSVVVDPQAQVWTLQQHCVQGNGISLLRSLEGPTDARPSHLFWLARNPRDPLEIVMTAPSVDEEGGWILIRCRMEGEGGCMSHLLMTVPASPILALRGLPVVSLSPTAVVVFAITEDARGLWIGEYDQRRSSPRTQRRLALPLAHASSIALLEGLTVARSQADVWIALAYGEPEPVDETGRSRYRSAAAVYRLPLARLRASR